MITPIRPNWHAPKAVHAVTTTRQGGVSSGCYQSLNLGAHVGDELINVECNRQRLANTLTMPNQPIWLEQIHSTQVVDLSLPGNDALQQQQTFNLTADAAYSATAGQVCAVLTADCLPVLLCSALGDEVAAVHAGWRGLCNGIIEQTVAHFKCDPTQIMAWLGPAIGPNKFEVGLEVKQQFENYDAKAEQAFVLINVQQQKYLANLYLLAKQRLNQLGIAAVYGGDYCTYTQEQLFYSYRREKQTGRMASVIWFE